MPKVSNDLLNSYKSIILNVLFFPIDSK